MHKKVKSKDENESINRVKLNTIQQTNQPDNQVQRCVSTTPILNLLSKQKKILSSKQKNKQTMSVEKTVSQSSPRRISYLKHKRNKTQTKSKQPNIINSNLYVPFIAEMNRTKIGSLLKRYSLEENQNKSQRKSITQMKNPIDISSRKNNLTEMKQTQKKCSLPTISDKSAKKSFKKITNTEVIPSDKQRLTNLKSFSIIIPDKSQNHSNQNDKNIKKYKQKQISQRKQIVKKNIQWKQIKFLQMKTRFYQMQRVMKEQNKQLNQTTITSKKKLSNQTMIKPKIIKIPAFPSNIQQVSNLIKKYEIHRSRKNSQKQVFDLNNLIRKKSFCVKFNQKQSLYFGQMQQGQYHGEGIFIKQDYLFEGNWNHGQKIYGVQAKKSGYYEGYFINDKRQGFGSYKWNNGTQQYLGQWKNGQKNGNGTWKNLQGDQYVGQWINGKVQGYGVHTTSQGQKYQGYFANFLKHGKAKEKFPNGDLFQGNYIDGKPQGFGVYKFKKHNMVYEGYFNKGLRNGHGKLTVPNFFVYQGQFKDDKVEGYGKLYYQNKDSYLGNFVNSKKNGIGSFHKFSQNITFNGLWKNDDFFQQNSKNKAS